MPRTKPAVRPKAKAITNANLYALINDQVLPEVREVKGILKKAGLDNGHADDVRLFFDKRANRQAGLRWLGQTFQPIAKVKFVVALIGVISSVAWAALGLHQLALMLRPPTH